MRVVLESCLGCLTILVSLWGCVNILLLEALCHAYGSSVVAATGVHGSRHGLWQFVRLLT